VHFEVGSDQKKWPVRAAQEALDAVGEKIGAITIGEVNGPAGVIEKIAVAADESAKASSELESDV